jgi:hypothetical protein
LKLKFVGSGTHSAAIALNDKRALIVNIEDAAEGGAASTGGAVTAAARDAEAIKSLLSGVHDAAIDGNVEVPESGVRDSESQ